MFRSRRAVWHRYRWSLLLAWGLLCLLLVFAVAVRAQTPTIPTQAQNTLNQEVTSGSNAAVSVTLTAAPHTRAHLYSVAARCSAGSAAVTVTDGGTQRWSSDAAFISTTTKSAVWMPGFTGGIGNAVVVTLGTCGSGNTGVMQVQGDIF